MKTKKRIEYLISFVLLVAVEVLIALYVDDTFVRPYLGDVIIVIVLYCLVRAVKPDGSKLLPVYIFVFAAAVETGQYFHYVDLIGLGDIRFFRILMGTSFSWYDILCYASGCALCALLQSFTVTKE